MAPIDDNITPEQKADEIYKLIGSKSVKVRNGPLHHGDEQQIKAIFAQAIRDDTPIPLMKYWAKGYADNIDPPEIDSVYPEREGVEFLASVARKIASLHKPGVILNVVFDDTHEKLNYNIPPTDYLDQMTTLFRNYFENGKAGLHFAGVTRLSDYIPDALDYTATPEGMEKLWTRAATALQHGTIDKDIAKKLAPRAGKYFKGDLGGLMANAQASQIGAMYHELCKSEREPVGEAFKGHIFFTYNSSKQHDFSVPANMPAFNIYAFPGKLTDKPWNIKPDELVRKQASNNYDRTIENHKYKEAKMTNTKSIAIIGGGLAGLSTAYQMLKENPDLALSLYEKDGKESYSTHDGSSHRASSSHSSARTMRIMGAKAGIGIWNVRETIAMLNELQGYSDTPLFYAQASVYLPKEFEDRGGYRGTQDATYIKYKQSLIDAGLEEGVGYSELSGAELKERFPGYYKTTPDSMRVLLEEPYDAERNPKGAAGYMDSEATMKAMIAYLEEKGADIHFDTEITTPSHGGEVVLSSGEKRNFDQVVVAPGNAVEQLVDCEEHGIKPGYDRVLVAHIDMAALGIKTSGFPFTKGWAPTPDAGGAAYNADSDPSSGVIKFLPGQLTQERNDPTVLQQELVDGPTNSAKQQALEAAYKRFGFEKMGISMDQLHANMQFHTCSYTRTKRGEKMFAGRLDDKTTMIGLDSSGSARVIGGLSKIATCAALGEDEPYEGALNEFGLAAHQAKVGSIATKAGPACPDFICPAAEAMGKEVN